MGFAFLDIDEFIWRKDTPKPFSVMYSREERIAQLQQAVSQAGRFVMAGSMDSFHQHFDPYFRLAVYLTAPAALRVERVHQREAAQFGARVLPGGDLYEEHQRFLEGVAGYERGMGGTTLERQRQWLQSLTCKVIYLDGTAPIESNVLAIQNEWSKVMSLTKNTHRSEEWQKNTTR